MYPLYATVQLNQRNFPSPTTIHPRATHIHTSSKTSLAISSFFSASPLRAIYTNLVSFHARARSNIAASGSSHRRLQSPVTRAALRGYSIAPAFLCHLYLPPAAARARFKVMCSAVLRSTRARGESQRHELSLSALPLRYIGGLVAAFGFVGLYWRSWWWWCGLEGFNFSQIAGEFHELEWMFLYT